MHDAMAVFLKIEPFARGICGDQQEEFRLGKIKESLFSFSAAQTSHEPCDSAFITVAVEETDEPIDCTGVFGEYDQLLARQLCMNCAQFSKEFFCLGFSIVWALQHQFL